MHVLYLYVVVFMLLLGFPRLAHRLDMLDCRGWGLLGKERVDGRLRSANYIILMYVPVV